ncbi:MAG: hypothetical protein K8U57_40020 [Planctomycetes bacterium]|nr:hypothetical protein [Planctomycetota bacterium]
MALIASIEQSTKERQKLHSPTRCLASSFTTDEGKAILQLDTYGSEDRTFTEKVSQSVQFDEDSARQLLQLIRETFPKLI